jgi:hypothetical protein
MNFDRQPNNRQIQMDDQAGHTKLTAVTIYHNGKYREFFVMLKHNGAGEAILPVNVLDKLLTQCHVQYGGTYSVA